ncbi:MAG: hypothetical protein HY471_01790 [Candidatus Sungbacteria bacterium]|nr:hypothetical protein [Candidatus Sungbacteria bacterium]
MEAVAAQASDLERAKLELAEKLGSKNQKYVRFVLAALGSVPWVGGLLGAMAGLSSEKDQDKVNEFQRLWLEEHKAKMKLLAGTIQEVLSRLDGFGEDVQRRIESQEYLTLVRRTFRSWDEADTDEKRQMFKQLLTNAGAITLCPDDLVRLFIHWIEDYHEAHFMVIKAIYQNPSITRGSVWDKIKGDRPQEDSAEADLFRYLIRELSTGGVIRQEREVNSSGEFLRHRSPGRVRGHTSSSTMESAFEDEKGYQLTKLGAQFVHYVMEDVVPQITEEN